MISNNPPDPTLYKMGIDVGTSGIRAVVIDFEDKIVFQTSVKMPFPDRKDTHSQQSTAVWQQSFFQLLEQCRPVLPQVGQLIVDATSSTVTLMDSQENVCCEALMYDDRRATKQANLIKNIAPANSGAHGASSTLSKVLWFQDNLPQNDYTICHQVDFINFLLTGKTNITDENNALKLGYDSVTNQWPEWLTPLLKMKLPLVVTPGTLIGRILPGLVDQFGFDADCKIYAGTTDSIAAFLASGANQTGDAVTSLGSTLAIKILSKQPIFAPEYGIYSHKLNNQWLVGGASNAGGAVLLNFFTVEKLIELLPKIDVTKPTGVNYYPILGKGERFPIADSELSTNYANRPKDSAIFLQALIEGLVEVEKLAFQRLAKLGSPKVTRIFTAGGGIQNSVWMQLRAQQLAAQITKAANIDAAFGVTRLLRN